MGSLWLAPQNRPRARLVSVGGVVGMQRPQRSWADRRMRLAPRSMRSGRKQGEWADRREGSASEEHSEETAVAGRSPQEQNHIHTTLAVGIGIVVAPDRLVLLRSNVRADTAGVHGAMLCTIACAQDGWELLLPLLMLLLLMEHAIVIEIASVRVRARGMASVS